jgi:hypothetical protein
MHGSQCFVKNVASQSSAVFLATPFLYCLTDRHPAESATRAGSCCAFPEDRRFGALERMLGAPISPLVDATT